jgi:hypothetical protein
MRVCGLAVKTGHFFRLTAGMAVQREAASFTGSGWQLSVMWRSACASFLFEGMTVTDVIGRADEALHRVKTSGEGNYSPADISVPEPLVVWVGA